MGHARAILGSPSPEQQLSIYKKILAQGLSVRKVEELVSENKSIKRSLKVDTYAKQQQALSELLGTKVQISGNKITITFHSESELCNILERIH
jgi:ParB family chromosome partitioning protein